MESSIIDRSYYVNLVRARLSDEGIIKTKDHLGNTISHEAFTDNQIYHYLDGSLNRFNLLFLKELKITDSETLKFADLIVQGAVITALSSKALIERGREFITSDSGVNFTPPNVSDTMMHQWEIEIADYRFKVGALAGHYI